MSGTPSTQALWPRRAASAVPRPAPRQRALLIDPAEGVEAPIKRGDAGERGACVASTGDSFLAR